MNKVLISIFLICLAAPGFYCQDVNIKNDDLLQYNKWRMSFKRSYLNEEEQIYRQQVFFDTLTILKNHKLNVDATFTVGLNQFSDMTSDEYVQRILNNHIAKQATKRNLESQEFAAPSSNLRGLQAVPSTVDWRKKGAAGPVKNQGQCGSCWTFSVAGTLEAFNYIKTGTYTQFSEQQLLDCANERFGYYSYGCDGGLQEEGIKYAMKYGIVPASQYKYVGVQGQCRVSKPVLPTQGFFPRQYSAVHKSIDGLKRAIASGPVSASVDATYWNYYNGGVFNYCGKNTQLEQLNHAVIAIGYDAQGNWIIKNSYGTSWGEQGFIRLASGNECGILMDNIVITA